MPEVNDEMKAASDLAIKAAKERFNQELDFSERSISVLENILERIYCDFSGLADVAVEDGLILETAIIWGGYLGEYMRLKWDGIWILIGSDKLVLIRNIEFSPINFVYQTITSHPGRSIKNYLLETEKKLWTSTISPEKSQLLSENISQPINQISIKPSEKPVIIDKRLLFTFAIIVEILLFISIFIIGYKIIKAGGLSAFGLIASPTSSNTNIPIEKTLGTATSYSTNTPTVTLFPTYTPRPTITPTPSYTPSPSYTPYPTNTQTATLTPTKTQKLIIPTRTSTQVPSPTTIPFYPTNTPTPTQLPTPTATESEPVVIESCAIDPFTVPVGYNVQITLLVHFSSNIPGYGFNSTFDPNYPQQSGCDGTDDDGDGVAFCLGSSGILPDSTTVHVTFSTSVGNCVASYSSR